MKEIILKPSNLIDSVKQIQSQIGGHITERYGEYTLNIDNDIAKGCIKFISFDWGVGLTEHNIIYFDDVLFVSHTTKLNPLLFIFCSKGNMFHRFSNEKEFNTIHDFHAAILASKKNVEHHTLYPKGQHLEINVISITRKEFLKKRINNVAQLNQKLHQAFIDKEGKEIFVYYSPIHIHMEDRVKALRDIDIRGMSRILQMEGDVYQLLSMHLSWHERSLNSVNQNTTLLKKELKIVRRYAKKILDNPSVNYTMEQLSKNSGLSQAKLQKGFRYLYTRTVTEYIRHVRLESARDLLTNSDLNISQIVYSIGFTSRSYFSKIFREKYNITPNEYKKQVVTTIGEEI